MNILEGRLKKSHPKSLKVISSNGHGKLSISGREGIVPDSPARW
jgi:hypothetical protein